MQIFNNWPAFPIDVPSCSNNYINLGSRNIDHKSVIVI